MSAFWLRLFGVLCLLGAGLYLAYLVMPERDALPVSRGETSGATWRSWLVRSLKACTTWFGNSGPRVTRGLVRARTWVQSVATVSVRASESTILELAREASLREGYDAGHAERVAELAVALGAAAGLGATLQDELRLAALLHDVAPTGIEDALLAPRSLSASEVNRLRSHPVACQVAVEELLPGSDAVWWVRMAHERSDGIGYPDGAFHDDLPVPVRCLTIAETYEALVHDRPYRSAFEPQEALLEMQQVAGTQLDVQLVKCFVEHVYPQWII